MDGGAECFKGAIPVARRADDVFKVVHTGALDYWRGLDFMKGVVKSCKRSDVKFILCGKCDKEQMWAEFGNDPRVEVNGFLPESEVNEICRRADVFLSVRTPGLGDNLVNYPSKIPNYLSWGVPVVSTWNDSFSPDYQTLLEVSDDTVEGFVKLLENTLEWNLEKRQLKYNDIRTWFEKFKNWDCQAMRLVTWLKEIVK
jgi:glycosyltransferase involved in cell wall biosynthesis